MPCVPADRAGRSTRPGHRWWRARAATSAWEGSAMKISMFHLMPYRELPADFEQRYQSVWVDPPFSELADASRVGQYYNWTLDELIYAAKSGMDGICVNEHHQNAYGFMPEPQPDGLGAGARHQRDGRRDRADGRDPADHQPADPRRRRVRDARLHQRRPARRRHAAGHSDGRQPLLRHHADRASRALLRGARPDHEGVDRAGDLRLERQVLQAPDGQPVAASDPEAASAGMGAGQRQSQHLGLRRQARPLLLLPELLRQQPRQARDGRLLGVRRQQRARAAIRIAPGFLQLVVVAETDAQAEKDYSEHIRYFYDKSLHILPNYLGPPGHQDYRSLEHSIRSRTAADGRDADATQGLEVQGFRRQPVRHRAAVPPPCATSCRTPSRSCASAT